MSNSTSNATMQPAAATGKAIARIVDSHIHLDQMEDHGSLLQNDSYHALIPGIDPDQFRALLEREDLARFDRCVGWHPWYLPDVQPTAEHEEMIASLSERGAAIGIGETGLDSLVADSKAKEELQEQWFKMQIRLSVELDLPLVIHCVRAHGRCWELLKDGGAEAVGGVIHAYSSSPEMAEQYQSLRFAVGIGSPVTREQSRRVRAAAAEVDERWLLLETDAPYMNIRTQPKGDGVMENITTVAEAVATLRQSDQKALQQQTAQNFERIFRRKLE